RAVLDDLVPAVGTEELGDRPGACRVCIAHFCRLGTLLCCVIDVRARGHGGPGTTTARGSPPPRRWEGGGWGPAPVLAAKTGRSARVMAGPWVSQVDATNQDPTV